VPWLRQLLTGRPGSIPVHKVALGRVYLYVLRLFLVIIIPTMLDIHLHARRRRSEVKPGNFEAPNILF
jgi:hypothetical protein